MCFPDVSGPEPIKVKKPVYVRNPFLDDEDSDARTADASRRGRSSLVIPSGTSIGFAGAGSTSELGIGGIARSPGQRRGAGTYGAAGSVVTHNSDGSVTETPRGGHPDTPYE